MLYINKVTADAQQQLTLTGIAGVLIGMTLRFMPRPQRWIMGLTYNTTSIQGEAVVTSANMIRQFKNNVPFGIACLRADGLDPYTINDFANQTANLYLLDAADVADLEAGFFT